MASNLPICGEGIATAKDEKRGRIEEHGHQAERRRNQHQSYQLWRAVAVHIFKRR